jgi:hypothetical protein
VAVTVICALCLICESFESPEDVVKPSNGSGCCVNSWAAQQFAVHRAQEILHPARTVWHMLHNSLGACSLSGWCKGCWLIHSFIHVTPVAEAHTSHACPSQMPLIPQSNQLIAEQSSTRPTDE